MACGAHRCAFPKTRHVTRISALLQAKALVDKHAGMDTTDVGLKEMHDLINQKLQDSEAEAANSSTTTPTSSSSLVGVSDAGAMSVYVSPYAGLPALRAGEPGALTKEVCLV